MKFSVVILSFNSEATIGETLRSVLPLSDDVHVVDSYSTDDTCNIIRACGVQLIQHPFVNYARQRNWAIEHLPLKYDWELHLDADEKLSAKLMDDLLDLKNSEKSIGVNGYCIPRLVQFQGRIIRHGGMYPIWHVRLFRHGRGRCEQTEYDQHFVVDEPLAKLRSWFVDDIRMPLSEWIGRHNRWSDAQVNELLSNSSKRGIRPNLRGNPLERKRYFKELYERMPLFHRAWLLFLYRYVLRCGFLDGKEGLIFFFLQTLWFRFLIDAKLFEVQTGRTTDAATITGRLSATVFGNDEDEDKQSAKLTSDSFEYKD